MKAKINGIELNSTTEQVRALWGEPYRIKKRNGLEVWLWAATPGSPDVPSQVRFRGERVVQVSGNRLQFGPVLLEEGDSLAELCEAFPETICLHSLPKLSSLELGWWTVPCGQSVELLVSQIGDEIQAFQLQRTCDGTL